MTRLTRGYEVGRFQRVKDVAAPVSHQNVSDDGVKLLLVFGWRQLVSEQSGGLVGPRKQDRGGALVFNADLVPDEPQAPLSQIPICTKTKLFKKAVGYIFWHFKALRLPNQSHAREHFIQI